MRHSSLGLLLCLVIVPLGCQIRESEVITEPAKRPFDWTAKIESGKEGYDAIFDWSPYVPATLIRYKKDKTTSEWKEIDRLDVPEKTDYAKFWPAQEQGAQYRFAIEVKDPTIDRSSAPQYLYLKVPKDGAIPQKDHVITPDKVTSAGVAHFRVNSRDSAPLLFHGGNFQLYAKYLAGGLALTELQLTNVGVPKNEKFNFVLKAERSFEPVKLEVGPFDPNGPVPHIDIRCLDASMLFYANGEQHPKQRVRLVSDENITYLLHGQKTSIAQHEGIYRKRMKSEKWLEEEMLMISTLGKIYHFGRYSDGKWAVIHDADFYPADFDAALYEKLDWKDTSIPEGIKNVKELIDTIALINGKNVRPLQFNLTSSYESLPDRKLIEVVKELKRREREFNVAKMFANVSEVYLHNITTESPVYAFMRQEILHSMGVGLKGTPTEIVDQLFTNFKEARLHVPER